jgi:hypothetical protein
MKTLARCSLLAITLFLCAAPAISTEWECGLKIKRNGQVVALPVYLYYKQNLTVPIRTGMSTANQIDVEQNFSFDIDDGPNYTQEPNSPNASWRYIVPGDYTLRVDSYYVYITISQQPVITAISLS